MATQGTPGQEEATEKRKLASAEKVLPPSNGTATEQGVPEPATTPPKPPSRAVIVAQLRKLARKPG